MIGLKSSLDHLSHPECNSRNTPQQSTILFGTELGLLWFGLKLGFVLVLRLGSGIGMTRMIILDGLTQWSKFDPLGITYLDHESRVLFAF